MSDHPMEKPEEEFPFIGNSDWYLYRCRRCGHADWVEDVFIDSFPPSQPEGTPEFLCPKCGGSFRWDTSTEIISSYDPPDHGS